MRNRSKNKKQDKPPDCGGLKKRNKNIALGSFVTIHFSNNQEKEVHWSGFATIEKLDWWKKISNGELVDIKADSFIEGKKEFSIPSQTISGLLLKKDVIVNGKTIGHSGTVKMLTRAASLENEKKIHSRWPLIVKDKKIIYFKSENLELF